MWLEAGRLQDSVTRCRPEVWEMVTCALRPRAIQGSNSAVKSTVAMDGGGQAHCSRCSMSAHSLPLSTPAQEG
jgi:hypothetical protein